MPAPKIFLLKAFSSTSPVLGNEPGDPPKLQLPSISSCHRPCQVAGTERSDLVGTIVSIVMTVGEPAGVRPAMGIEISNGNQ
jgi:hypothetical protein